MRTAALALAGIAASGCSFIFVHGPPRNHENSVAFECTSSVVAPVLDTVWAGLNGIGAISAASTDEATWNSRSTTSRGAVIAVGAGWFLLSGASAIYGFTRTQSCRDAERDLAVRLATRPPPSPGFVPAPAGPEEGCSRDVDCKGDRICVNRECVSPAK
jgi:hypothetical protein